MIKRMHRIAALMVIAVFLASCAGGTTLGARDMRAPVELSGTFDLILYGGTHSDDLETVAFFDIVGDGYELVPYDPDFEFETLKAVDAEEAMGMARKHVGWHREVIRTHMRRIKSETGSTIGYEMRPLYSPITFGETDILEIRYWLVEGGKVMISVDIKDRIKDKFRQNGNDRIREE